MDSNYFKTFKAKNKILQLVLDSKISINKTYRTMDKIEMVVANTRKFITKINPTKIKFSKCRVKTK